MPLVVEQHTGVDQRDAGHLVGEPVPPQPRTGLCRTKRPDTVVPALVRQRSGRLSPIGPLRPPMTGRPPRTRTHPPPTKPLMYAMFDHLTSSLMGWRPWCPVGAKRL